MEKGVENFFRSDKCNLLILDDWGIAEITAADSRDILEVIDDRIHIGATLLASQIFLSDWYALFSDPTLADACRIGWYITRTGLNSPVIP
jgi:DNA replication protein DnaC